MKNIYSERKNFNLVNKNYIKYSYIYILVL